MFGNDLTQADSFGTPRRQAVDFRARPEEHPDFRRFNIGGLYKDYTCEQCGGRVTTRDIAETICRICRAVVKTDTQADGCHFGDSDEAPCDDCGGHPLLAVHDSNGGRYTHKYSPRVDAPAAKREEWRVVPEPVAPIVAAIYDGELIVASCMTTETAERIVRNHRLAGLVSELIAVLEATVCHRCNNRIGWTEPHEPGFHRSDWAKCSSCKRTRAALTAISKERGE